MTIEINFNFANFYQPVNKKNSLNKKKNNQSGFYFLVKIAKNKSKPRIIVIFALNLKKKKPTKPNI